MLVRVTAYTNAIEAHLARSRLEAEGIPAFVFHEHHIWVDWLVSLAIGGVKIHVHANDLERAREIITSHDSGEYALQDEEKLSCPRCQSNHIERRRLSWKSALLTTNLLGVPLYFRWATLRCPVCLRAWDLPLTRAYSFSVIFMAAVAIGSVLLAFTLIGMCSGNVDSTLISPFSRGCRS